ncbi:MAG: alpha/beta hydrolase [Syntrophaceae bacterium]
MRSRFIKVVLCFLFCFTLPIAAAHACNVPASGYGYRIAGSYDATILGTPEDLKLPGPERIDVRPLVLDILPGLKRPDVFYYDEGLHCMFARQKGKAPLVFLIAGTGANDRSNKVIAMMRALYKSGFHVITLPSPSHPNFIISASRSHVPGDLAEEAVDLYRVMEIAWKKVRKDVDVSEFHLSGYSLGGTHAAFVAKLDEERRVFNFRKVLMLNPAVNLYNSIVKLEDLLDRIPGGRRKIGAWLNLMMARLTDYYRTGDFTEINTEFLYTAYKAGLFTEDESGGLIGVSFRISLAGLIFASDVMTRGGYVVPKNRELTGSDPLGDYFLVCFHLSFLDYFDEYFYPYMRKKRPGMSREALIESLGLPSIEGYLRSSPKIGVVTNENDFILDRGEIDYLRRLFGDRAVIYPRGGHLGNLEYRDNMVEFINFFKR